MVTMAEARRIKDTVEADLLKLPGVTGVDVGYKVVGGTETRTPAIRVYVEKKQTLPAAQAIPAEIDGIPTDVIERRFVLH